jgi:two-component system, response regulator YesN
MEALLNVQEGLEGFTIVTGSVYPCDPENAAKSYHEAAQALEYCFINDAPILYFDNLQLSARKDTGRYERSYAHLEEAVRTANKEKQIQIVNEIAEEIRTKLYTMSYSRSVLGDVLSAIVKGLKSAGFNAQEVYGMDIRDRGMEMPSLQQFVIWLEEIISTAVNLVSQKRRLSDFELEEKLKQYIENNLFNDVSLESISEFVGMSPNYVSKLFHTMVGKTFIDYVTDLKMEKASTMLLERDLSVQEISDKLGYRSTPHFIRVFKEKYGHTPKQYQKQSL